MTKEQITINSLELENKSLKWKMERLKSQLENYCKLQSEVHKGIERVWSIDTYPSLNSDGGDEKLLKQINKERSEIIEEVFYKIANQWID